MAYHFYAMSVEAAARVDIGEQHTGILLATTAIGAIESIQGSEYGMATRAICCEAMRKAGSPQADEMTKRAAAYATGLVESIRDPVLRQLCRRRPVVTRLLGPAPGAEDGSLQPSAPDVASSSGPPSG